MSDDIKEFYDLLNRFYERGFLKEVFNSEKAIVCNAYNQFYIAFSKALIKKYDNAGFPGFVMNSKGLRYIVEDDNFVNQYYGALSDEEQDKVLAFLDEKLFDFWEKHDLDFKQKPTGKNMDLEFEAELLAKGPDAFRKQAPRKRGFFNFFKK